MSQAKGALRATFGQYLAKGYGLQLVCRCYLVCVSKTDQQGYTMCKLQNFHSGPLDQDLYSE
jgi:hypothetical protein